jgi:hypothetical protein
MAGKLLLSLGITSLVSLLAGLIFISNFWLVFFFVFILQILFFYFFNSIYENKLILKARELKLQELREVNKNTVVLPCPCFEKNKQSVELNFDKDLIYKCSKCEKNIKAFTDIKTILTTEPIYFDDRN